MTALVWDQTGERLYETGVDHGVLYIPDQSGAYSLGVAWNGLTTVTESPSGAEANAQYADNIKYLNLFSAEEFGATIEAFTYPDEFAQFDGLAVPSPGVAISQQARRAFGLSFRTKVGNDVDGEDHGYKLHLVYGATASPSEKAYASINDSPEAITFSWTVTTVPTPVTGYRPTSLITVDSSKVGASDLTDLENFLYGTAGGDPRLPSPDEVISIFGTGLQEVTPVQPTFDQPTNTITIPASDGYQYYINNVPQIAGDVIITEDTVVVAKPDSGYKFPPVSDSDWLYTFV
jgi:hypothetical protein